MLSLTKRRERHGILAGNENRILGRSACPVFTPHRGLRQRKRRSYGKNEKTHHRKRALAGRYNYMGSALGQSPYNTAPFVPLRCMHPRAVEFACPNTSRRKISYFHPAPHHRSPCAGMGRLFRCCGGTGLYHRLSQAHHGTLCQKRSGQTPL